MESHEMIPTDMKKNGQHNDLDAQLNEVAELPEPKKAKLSPKSTRGGRLQLFGVTFKCF